MGSIPHLWFCVCKTATLGLELQVSIGPRTHLWFSAFKIACLASELLVSMGPSPHVWFLDAKQRLMDRNKKSLWVPDITCRLCLQNCVSCTRMTSLYRFQPSSVFFFMQNSDFVTRRTSLYGSQTSFVVLSTHTSVLSTRIKRLYGFQPSPVILCMQNSDFSTWITSLYGSQGLWFLLAKQRLLDPNNKSQWVPDMTCRFVRAKQHD